MAEAAGGTALAPAGRRDRRYREVRRVTVVGTWIDLALGAGKITAGWLAHSQALIADGVHSLSDLGTDVLVLVAAHHARAAADDEHPYGHERIETVATVLLGAVLVVVGAGIAWDAVSRLFHPERLWSPEPWALAVAALSVAIKEGLYQYTRRSARRLRSALLEANAWHHRSDAASSVVVIIGVGAVLAGLRDLDALAALVVAYMIARVGIELARRGLRELIDTGLAPERVALIRRAILDVDGVRDLHLLRTRQMGGKALVDVHILLDDPRLSVSEGHQISEAVRAQLIASIDDVEDVTVHIDPEDDQDLPPGGVDLALRAELLERLERCWSGIDEAAEVRRVLLHYLDGRVHVELELPLRLVGGEADAERLRERFREAIADEPEVADVRLLFS